MALAETAELAVLLKLQDQLSGPMKGVTARIKELESTSGRSFTAVQGGFSRAGKAASSFGGAIGHAKGAVGGLLAGPLGLIGLGGGLLGLGLGFEQVISHTNEFAFSVEKLTALSGDTAEHMSGLLAVFQKFGVNAERTGMIVGFTEKTLGKLAETSITAGKSTNKLIALDKEYGISLINSKGHVADFQTTLLAVADVYQKNIDVSAKARLAALLFGRGYADLVPILALGRQGILDAEAAAKDLGLTLTAQNAKDLKDYRESLREASDAVGGLELQIGLALVPAIKDMADSITSFLAHGGRQGIVSFFKDAITAGRGFADMIQTSVIPVIKGITGAWNSLPPEFRDLIVKGVVAEKAVKFLFGFSPTSLIKDALFSRGSATNPMFVHEVAGGLGAPGTPGGGVGGIIKGALPLILPLAAGIAAGVAVANSQTGDSNPQAVNDAVKSGALGFNGRVFTQGNAFSRANSPDARAAAATQAAGEQAAMDARRVEAAENRTALAVRGSGSLIAQQIDSLHRQFRSDLHSLINATKNSDIAKFAKRIQSEILHGVGSAAGTKGVLADLQAKLTQTDDPKTRQVLNSAIRAVQAKLPNREFVQGQLDAAKKIAASAESQSRKLTDITAIQKILRQHGDTSAAKTLDHLKSVATKIDAAKAKASADTRSETAGIRAAIAAQQTQITIPITNYVSVSNHDIVRQQTTYRKISGVIQS